MYTTNTNLQFRNSDCCRSSCHRRVCCTVLLCNNDENVICKLWLNIAMLPDAMLCCVQEWKHHFTGTQALRRAHQTSDELYSCNKPIDLICDCTCTCTQQLTNKTYIPYTHVPISLQHILRIHNYFLYIHASIFYILHREIQTFSIEF